MVYLSGDIKGDDTSVRNYMNAWAVFHQLKEGDDDLGDHDIEPTHASNSALFDHLYENLTIIDSKAGVLMASSSIFTAALGIIWAQIGKYFVDLQSVLSWSIAVAITASIALSVVSVLLVVSVVYIRWATKAELESRSLKPLVEALIKTRNGRTLRYRWGLLLHLGAIGSACLTFALVIIKLLLATGGTT